MRSLSRKPRALGKPPFLPMTSHASCIVARPTGGRKRVQGVVRLPATSGACKLWAERVPCQHAAISAGRPSLPLIRVQTGAARCSVPRVPAGERLICCVLPGNRRAGVPVTCRQGKRAEAQETEGKRKGSGREAEGRAGEILPLASRVRRTIRLAREQNTWRLPVRLSRGAPGIHMLRIGPSDQDKRLESCKPRAPRSATYL